jgi:hypothetical protein
MRMRQIALVAHQLEPVVEDLCSVLGIEVAFRDPGVGIFGLHNAVMPIGDTFLEVVSPVKEGTSAGRLLERRRGDGGYMVILQTEDLQADRKRLSELGVREVWEIELDDIASVHLHPRDLGGAILSLDEAHPPDSWRWAGPDWESARRTERSQWITGVELQALDPAAMARRWSRALAHPLIDPEDESFEIPLDAGNIRFVRDRDGRGEGFSAFEVKTADPAAVLAEARARGLETGERQVRIGGTRIDLS